jgi:hypothetical protein
VQQRPVQTIDVDGAAVEYIEVTQADIVLANRLCRPKVALRASADRREVLQGELATADRIASRVDRSTRRNPQRVRVFSATDGGNTEVIGCRKVYSITRVDGPSA